MGKEHKSKDSSTNKNTSANTNENKEATKVEPKSATKNVTKTSAKNSAKETVKDTVKDTTKTKKEVEDVSISTPPHEPKTKTKSAEKVKLFHTYAGNSAIIDRLKIPEKFTVTN